MSGDAPKIEQFKAAIQNKPDRADAEIISLALSIEDFEERDLALLQIVESLAESADWNKSFGVAQLIEGGYERAQALHNIAVKMASNGRLERALFVFSEAETEIENADSLWQQAELLHEIAKSLDAVCATHKAGEVWEKAASVAQRGEASSNQQDSLDAASVLTEIAENFAFAGGIEKAMKIAESIKNTARRERTLKTITDYAEQIRQAA